jgi:hypothetical protein
MRVVHSPTLKCPGLITGVTIGLSIAMVLVLTYIETGSADIYQEASALICMSCFLHGSSSSERGGGSGWGSGGGSHDGGGNSANQGITQSQ